MKQVFRREVAKSEVFPPDGLVFPPVPIQHERKEPARLLFGGPFADVVGYTVYETCYKCGDLSLPIIEPGTDLRSRCRRPVDDCALSDKIRSNRFQPIP